MSSLIPARARLTVKPKTHPLLAVPRLIARNHSPGREALGGEKPCVREVSRCRCISCYRREWKLRSRT
jgi:hypothetical protein